MLLRNSIHPHWLVNFILLFIVSITTCSAIAEESLERTVEAAFLYKFGRFVDWPDSSFSAEGSQFNLCMIGDDPFGSLLDNIVEGEQINGHTIAIHRLKTVDNTTNCHILYIGRTPTLDMSQIRASLHNRNILTVSNPGKSNASIAIINFVIANNRVRFNIDDEAAAQNNLIISSRLLNLALNVKLRQAKETP